MSDISAAIRAKLVAESSVTDEVGTRIYSDHLPQNAAMPAITYRVISEIANEDLAGSSGLDEARIQVDCFGSTRSQANSVQRLVRSALKGFRGVVSSVYVKTINQSTGQQHLTDRPEHGTDQRRYITSQDFSVFYQTD